MENILTEFLNKDLAEKITSFTVTIHEDLMKELKKKVKKISSSS